MLLLALFAAVAMLVQQCICVLLVQAEARNHAPLTAVLSAANWLTGIYSTAISVTALQHDGAAEKYALLGIVATANLIGAFTGVLIGRRFIKEEPMASDKGAEGTHASDEGKCGGQVKDGSCAGCGADNIKPSNVKGR